jgi:STE24 endopeptidase
VDSDRPALARRAALATALLSGLVLAVLAAVLVPWDWVPGGSLTPVPEHQLFSAAEIRHAEDYAAARRALSWSSYFLSLLLAVALGLTRVGSGIVRRIGGGLPWWLAVLGGSLALLLITRLLQLPFAVAIHRLDLSNGLTNQGPGGWAADQLRSLLVGWVMTALILIVLVGTARASARFWFAWAGGAACVLTIAGSFLYPVLVEPVFNNFTSMQPGPFKQSVFRLADREGVSIDDVLVSDASRRTTTLNAYVSGFGDTRRVVVYDNLVNQLSPAKARVVIAHELAHAKNNDVLLGTALGAVGSVFGVALLALLLQSRWLTTQAGYRGPGDPAVIALVMALFAVGTFVASPIENSVSRAIEARADRMAIAATHRGHVFVEMQRELAIQSLNDPTPPRWSQLWFGSHPTVLQRAGLPESLKAS